MNKDLFFKNIMKFEPLKISYTFTLGHRCLYELNFLFCKYLLNPRVETVEFIFFLNCILNPIFVYRVIDLGSGSGVCGLLLSSGNFRFHLTLVDKFLDVLTFTIINSIKSMCFNFRYLCSDWFQLFTIGCKFNLLFSNPPYVSKEEMSFFRCSDFYAFNSLFSSSYGFKDIIKIINTSYVFLDFNGYIFIEHGYLQSKFVRALLLVSGFNNIFVYKDFFHLDRFVFAEK